VKSRTFPLSKNQQCHCQFWASFKSGVRDRKYDSEIREYKFEGRRLSKGGCGFSRFFRVMSLYQALTAPSVYPASSRWASELWPWQKLGAFGSSEYSLVKIFPKLFSMIEQDLCFSFLVICCLRTVLQWALGRTLKSCWSNNCRTTNIFPRRSHPPPQKKT
jgi:hypothetical protein